MVLQINCMENFLHLLGGVNPLHQLTFYVVQNCRQGHMLDHWFDICILELKTQAVQMLIDQICYSGIPNGCVIINLLQKY